MAIEWVTWTSPGSWIAVAVVVALLVAGWQIAVASGSATAVSRHWFYVPIVVAGAWFGPVAGLVVGVVSMLVAGPLVALPEDQQVLNTAGVWAVRGPFFVGVGALVGLLTAVVRGQMARQAEVLDMQRELERQRATLIQTVSHEFRTPLTTISGITETLSRREPELADEHRIRLLGALVRSTSDLRGLVEMVLAAGETLDAATAHHEPLDVDELVGQAAMLLPERLDPLARIEVDVPAGARTVVSAPDVLRPLVRALLDNALKFSGDQPVTVTSVRGRDQVTITIRDRGPGLPAGYQGLFEPFTQGDSSTTRAHGGLGVGLYLAQRLAAQLRAIVTLENHAQGGAVATVTIPQQRDADRSRQPRDPSSSLASGKGRP